MCEVCRVCRVYKVLGVLIFSLTLKILWATSIAACADYFGIAHPIELSGSRFCFHVINTAACNLPLSYFVLSSTSFLKLWL